MTEIKKDILKIIYKELFSVKFLHSGYGISRKNFIANNISVIPDSNTKKIFNGQDLGFHLLNDTLICFIRATLQSPAVIEPKLPFIRFAGNVRIRFLLNATTDFFSKTVVAITGTKEVYYFTNRVNAATGGIICMNTAAVNSDDLKNTDTVMPEKNCFAVIDIFNNGTINSNYDLYQGMATQVLKSPVFTIPFKSKI